MPGGRLTHHERQAIAEGLREGLSYTDIAGRLGRPISTVTREVARNGGPAAYRADAAHRATTGRARRRKQPPAPAASPTGGDFHGRDPEAVLELEEQFTAMMVGTGLPRMTARVLTCLYVTDEGSLTATELAQRLQVSPASVSKAVGELEQQELIRRERDPGRMTRPVRDRRRRLVPRLDGQRPPERHAGRLHPAQRPGPRRHDTRRNPDAGHRPLLRARRADHDRSGRAMAAGRCREARHNRLRHRTHATAHAHAPSART